ncbi:unnamed protein product [Meganyctiphanes norvegica]|uniref:Phosphodiesterase n=1 Tax=Meganyctiphanes norvegica TaxID=48144 RepID=A0AAV2PSX3_MEGNR
MEVDVATTEGVGSSGAAAPVVADVAPPAGDLDPLSLLQLVANLHDQDAQSLQVKINKFLVEKCGASMAFLLLVSDDEEELQVHVVGDTKLSTPIKVPVKNNSFTRALVSRQVMTLQDISPAHREDIWRLLGLETNGHRNGRLPSSLQQASTSNKLTNGRAPGEGARKKCDENKVTEGPTRKDGMVHRDSTSYLGRIKYHGGDHGGAERTHPVKKHSGTWPLLTVIPESLMCVPISRPERDTAQVLVCLLDKKTHSNFTQRDEAIVRECFKYTIGVLLNTLAYERERQARTQCQSLLTVAKNLFIHLDDLPVLLKEVMTEARNLTGAERCSLFLLEQNQLVAKVFDGEKKKKADEEVRLPMDQGIAGQVATTGQLLNIRDAYSHPLFYRGFDQATGFKTRNILCFPIKEDNEVIGVAELCNKSTGSHFTAFDEEIATAFSIYCGISISHSLLYKKATDTQYRNKLSNELMMFHMKVTSEEVAKLVEVNVPEPNDFHGDFCSFKYFPRNLAVNGTPLAVISMMDTLGMIQRWRISKETLARFTLMVRKGYRDPPYHNWLHAFSVTHFTFLLLHNLSLTNQGTLDDLEAFALFVASMCHDLDHRGTTNSFQVASNSVLASLYSSEGSVMERHHLAQAMCILNTEDCNILETLSQEDYTRCLDLLRDIILATDLAHHLRIVNELREVANTGYDKKNPRHHQLLLCLSMTAADLSDQTKDWQSSKHVAELIYKEFFTQGDLEKAMGNEPVEMMDRDKAFIPELQLGFLDEVAVPVYQILAQMFSDAKEPYENILTSRRKWNRLHDIYKRRKHNSTSSLEIFEDDSLEEELLREEL